METLQSLLHLALPVSLVLLILSVGLRAEFDDLFYLVRRPGLLVRAILAVNVIVPLAAIAVVSFMSGIPDVAKAGLLLMAASPVPPFVPGQQAKVSGAHAYSTGLYATMVVLTLITVPVTMAVFGGVYGLALSTPMSKVVTSVLLTVLLPLAVGIGLRRLAPETLSRIAPKIQLAAMLLLAVAIVPILITVWPAVRGLVGDGTYLAMAMVVVVALIGGHLLGGPDPDDRSALAVTAAIRHPGIALALAGANAADKRIAAAVLGFVIVQLTLATIYGLVLKRRRGAAAA